MLEVGLGSNGGSVMALVFEAEEQFGVGGVI